MKIYFIFVIIPFFLVFEPLLIKADEIHDAIIDNSRRGTELGLTLYKRAKIMRENFLKEWNAFSSEEKKIYETLQNTEALYFDKYEIPLSAENTNEFVEHFNISDDKIEFVIRNINKIKDEYNFQKTILPNVYCLPVCCLLFSPRKYDIKEDIIEVINKYKQKNNNKYPQISEENIRSMMKIVKADNSEYYFVKLIMSEAKINGEYLDNFMDSIYDYIGR